MSDIDTDGCDYILRFYCIDLLELRYSRGASFERSIMWSKWVTDLQILQRKLNTHKRGMHCFVCL